MEEKPLISFDYAIKYLLKDKGDYEIVEGFISALLKSQGYPSIKIIALLDTESNKEDNMGKRSLADVVVEDKEKNKYIIEIERNIKNTFIHKACFNTSRLIIDHIAHGVDYNNIIKVFHISLLYFAVGKGAIHHGKTIIQDIKSKEPLTLHIKDPETQEIFDATDIFPEYFFISVPLFADQLEEEIDDWLYVMKYDNVPPVFHSPYMQKVMDKLSVLKMTAEERRRYFAYQKKLCDERNELQTAEARGMAKGEAIGEARGVTKGEAQLIKRMMDNGRSLEDISNATGMSVSEINQLVTLISSQSPTLPANSEVFLN